MDDKFKSTVASITSTSDSVTLNALGSRVVGGVGGVGKASDGLGGLAGATGGAGKLGAGKGLSGNVESGHVGKLVSSAGGFSGAGKPI